MLKILRINFSLRQEKYWILEPQTDRERVLIGLDLLYDEISEEILGSSTLDTLADDDIASPDS